MQDDVFKDSYRNTLEGEPHFLLWPTKYKTLPPVASLHHHYNIWNGLSINYRNKEYIENFFFAFDRNSDDKSQFYMKNQQLLVKFCSYFKVMAKDLIDNQDSRILAKYINKFDISPLEANILARKEFISEISYKENFAFVNNDRKLIQLTTRESECISILMKGRTLKEIAKILDLSPRTVGHYIENAKQKLGVNYKSQLIDIFSNT